MNKTQQSAYHNILQGFQNMADEILLPRLEPEELYNVFSSSVWITQRSSGRRDFATNIIRIPRT